MSKRYKPSKATAVFLIVTVLSLLVINTGLDALAASVAPVYYTGNDKDLPSPPLGLEFLKFDPPNTGTKKSGDIQVYAEFSWDKKSVDFESNTLVAYVFVKAGNGGYLYTYQNGVYKDNDLKSPKNQDNSGNRAKISHVTFYFKPTPTPTPDQTPTPTPDSTPTPTPDPTPTPTPDPTPTPTPDPTPTPTPDPTPTPTPDPTPTPTPDPTPTPTPDSTSTPTPDPTPTPTPDPTPTLDPTPIPEIELDDDEIPGGEIAGETTGEETADEIILDEELPGASAQLPKTGEIPPFAFYSAGMILAAIGVQIKGKRKNRQGKK